MVQGGMFRWDASRRIPEEFRRDAVALYRAAGGKRTYAAVAAALDITAESLRTWVRKERVPDTARASRGRRKPG